MNGFFLKTKKQSRNKLKNIEREKSIFPPEIMLFMALFKKKRISLHNRENVHACPIFIDFLNLFRPECLPYCVKYLLESGLLKIKVLMKAYSSSPEKKQLNENTTKHFLPQVLLWAKTRKYTRMPLKSFASRTVRHT